MKIRQLKNYLTLILGFVCLSTFGQKNKNTLERPKLVVGIVVDQMRYDYLYRYWNKYGNDGFKRLLQKGFSYENTHYNYEPTYTGPGHASIYTGTTPAGHGIVGNDWFNRATGRNIYCTEDKSVQSVGSTSVWGQMSPANLLATTITDQLRMATNMQSKVIGVCIKDRGSIIPAGHAANAAYWYDGTNGSWISSTYYMKELPAWVQQFNNRKLADKYLSQPWNTLLPIEQYTESTPDDNEFEKTFAGEKRPVFPHNLPALRGKSWDLIRSTPFGNTLTKDFALEAIKNENLGKGSNTDFLALSFSSTDYVGHQFGPNSVEAEDTYIRLDKDIAEVLNFLDKQVGENQYLIFLSADHGGAPVPAYAKSIKVPGGTVSSPEIQDSVKQFLNIKYGKADWVHTFINRQIYLNHKTITAKKVNLAEMQQKVADYLLHFEGVLKTTPATALAGSSPESGVESYLQKGYLSLRSGDVLVTLLPGWFEGYAGKETKGSTHGSSNAYDTHVPLLWYGWQVKNGASSTRVSITDIAPTIAQWLHITEPTSTTGRPLQEVLNR
ncbi:alkaline phosphatase PafA [Adhaeribacter aquaticus]|uniref:alkaline phosphatase PafA n=1 Tax=Adhaeribacter aquaticus TaxID=299567 RepID=UPI00040B2C80|nr:alkaline phosphatase PafA [Adhaeribacter aquaticus]